jgi:hypothetical protein
MIEAARSTGRTINEAAKAFSMDSDERSELVHTPVISEPELSGAPRYQISVFL